MKLKIATYNIHKGVSSIGSRPRVQELKAAIGSMDADIIFLQEVQGRHDLHALRYAGSWPMEGQHDFLAGEGQHVAYGLNAAYDHGHHGNALMSNFPIIHSRNQDVSDHAYEARGILHCVTRAENTDIHCFVVHLGLFAGSRKRQTEALVEAVANSAPAGAPVIIAGDFNDWENRLSQTLFDQLQVCEVSDAGLSSRGFGTYLRRLAGRGPKIQPARTFPAAMPMLQLDRIYVRGFEIESAKVLHGVRWARLSDHAPLIATLRLRSAT
ncbi:endonuclease/exonuclease/phosphatase family protein [Lacisediminimonas profundi]|uniref:endonuclease/exonuclease/phosphatase family protein n=1 Tax=Lacisediminimonas profundi TaxID=2603856 RepID=UPI00124B7C2F|nr:endonuclease/exonuclease/phosphatase family protein [Lacisediminimonas profundi]